MTSYLRDSRYLSFLVNLNCLKGAIIFHMLIKMHQKIRIYLVSWVFDLTKDYI